MQDGQDGTYGCGQGGFPISAEGRIQHPDLEMLMSFAEQSPCPGVVPPGSPRPEWGASLLSTGVSQWCKSPVTPSGFQLTPLRHRSSHAGNHPAVTSTLHEALPLEGAFCSLHVSLDHITIFPVSYQYHPRKASAVPGLPQPIFFLTLSFSTRVNLVCRI